VISAGITQKEVLVNLHLNWATHWRGRLHDALVRREEIITVLVTLCGVLAVLSGASWCLIKEDTFLYLYLCLHLSYLIGQKYWKFRDGNQVAAGNRVSHKEA
jgi:hypothetical protein